MKKSEIVQALNIPQQGFHVEPKVCNRPECARAVDTVLDAMQGRSVKAVRNSLENDMETVYLKAGCDPNICLPLKRIRGR